MMRVLTALPDLPQQRYILNPERGFVSIIVPIARTNLITNGSFETNTTSWTASGASIARSTTVQYHGAYSLAVTPTSATTDGVFYGTVSLTSGTTYAASVKIYGAAGVPYKISFATTGGVDLAAYRFVGTGRWQWVWVYYTETSSTTRRIYVTKDSHASTAVFYIDGAQVEALGSGETVSTYIDGDQQSLLAAGQFPPAYGWNGTRHASTSYRTAQTRDGGQVKNFDAFRLFVTALVGLGLATPTHYAAQSGAADGAIYQTTLINTREFTVSGRFLTQSPTDRAQRRAALANALNLDATAPRQPFALLYQEHDSLTPMGDAGTIVASYKDGLGNRLDNVIGEDVDAQFIQWLPFIASHESGAALTQSETITVTEQGNLMYRDATGDWSRIASIANPSVVNDIAQHPDGTYYIVGDFTTIGGTSANHIARYDPVTNTFSALGTGLSTSGLRVRISPDGNVFVIGGFTTANGVTVNRVTYWNGTTFVAMGSGGTKGVDNTARGITIDAAGNAYVVGQFLNAGGAGATRIAKWTKATDAWSALSTGLNGTGEAATTALDGTTIYVGGAFTTAGGVSAIGVAKWDGSAFTALGSGLGTADARDLLTAPDGSIYVAGNFTTAGGFTVNHIARWNGSGWSALGSGVTSGTLTSDVINGSDGLLYVAGDIQAVNGITTSDPFAAWNGSSWILPDIDMAGTPSVQAIASGRRGELMVSFFQGTASNASAAQLNTLTNDGTAQTFPTIRITGPSSSTSRLHQIRSYTTGRILSFNLTIFANEEITITTGPNVVNVRSASRGDLSQYVLPGSAPEFPLLKGANSVALLITGGTVTAVGTWQKRYIDAAGLAYGAP